jgi:hypothetical protein
MLFGWIKIFHDLIIGYTSEQIGIYSSIEKTLKIIQTFAFLGNSLVRLTLSESIHGLLGIVKSPFLTSFLQTLGKN